MTKIDFEYCRFEVAVVLPSKNNDDYSSYNFNNLERCNKGKWRQDEIDHVGDIIQKMDKLVTLHL